MTGSLFRERLLEEGGQRSPSFPLSASFVEVREGGGSGVCVSTPVPKDTTSRKIIIIHTFTEMSQIKRQGVVARQRVYQRRRSLRRRSLSLGDTGTDHPSAPAKFLIASSCFTYVHHQPAPAHIEAPPQAAPPQASPAHIPVPNPAPTTEQVTAPTEAGLCHHQIFHPLHSPSSAPESR